MHRKTVFKLVARVATVLILLYASSSITQYVEWIVRRQAGGPILLMNTYWARNLPEFFLLALAGFVLAVPDDYRQRSICWQRFLLPAIPALIVALFLPFLHHNPLTKYASVYGKFTARLLVLSTYRSVGGFWFGVSLALASSNLVS